MTTNGSGSACDSGPMVTWRSCIASSSALCVFAGARLISSARTTLAKMGPARSENVPSRGESTYVPVMSAGRRSGVNWMRRAEQPSVVAKALTSVVFATPGTPSRRACPRASRATSIVSTGSDDPMYTRATSRRTSSMRSRAAAISLVFAAAVTGSPPNLSRPAELGADVAHLGGHGQHVCVARPIPAEPRTPRSPRQPGLDARQGGQEARQGPGAALVEEARGPQARDELVGRGRAVEAQARGELLFERAFELEDRQHTRGARSPQDRRVPGDAAPRDDGHRARKPRRGVRVRLAGAKARPDEDADPDEQRHDVGGHRRHALVAEGLQRIGERAPDLAGRGRDGGLVAERPGHLEVVREHVELAGVLAGRLLLERVANEGQGER